MIGRAELLLILNAADSAEQINALESLFNRGLVAAEIDGDSIVAIRTTDKGSAALNAVTLPPASA